MKQLPFDQKPKIIITTNFALGISATLRIFNENGDCIKEFPFDSEIDAQRRLDYWFEEKCIIAGLTLKLSEFADGNAGSIKLVAHVNGSDYIRRELFIQP